MAFSEATRKATSTLAATTCAPARGPDALRMKAVERGSTAWTRAVVCPGLASTATQSPAAGRDMSEAAFINGPVARASISPSSVIRR